jgi:hypothetical protein
MLIQDAYAALSGVAVEAHSTPPQGCDIPGTLDDK